MLINAFSHVFRWRWCCFAHLPLPWSSQKISLRAHEGRAWGEKPMCWRGQRRKADGTWTQALWDAQSGARKRKYCLLAFDSDFSGLPWWLSGKNPLAMREMWVWFLCREDPLEKEMAVQSSILAWEIPWTEEPVRLQSTGSQRVRHDWVTRRPLIVCTSSSGCYHPVLMSFLYKTLAEWLRLNWILDGSG